MKRWILLLVSLAFAVSPALADDTAPERIAEMSLEQLVGKWRIAYGDTMLGQVQGEATIDANRRVRVTLTHPQTGETFRLESTQVRWQAPDQLHVTLEGPSPSGPPLPAPALGEITPLHVVPEYPEVRVIAGNHREKLPLKAAAPAELDTVHLTLKATDAQQLTGQWRYRASVLTERDAAGRGRVGVFSRREADGRIVGEQAGNELWLKQKAQVVATLCLQDQMRVEDGVVSYEYPTPDEGERRTLIVFGRNLPQQPGDPAVFTSDDKKIEYSLAALPEEAKRHPVYMQDLERAWAQLLEGASASQAAALRQLDVVILTAHLSHGVRPGQRRLTLNDAAGRWQLGFGDARAHVDFIRKVRDETWETTTDLFLPETFQLQVRTVSALPFDQIPLLLGVEKQVKLGVAPRLVARRSADDPKLYRTDLIELRRLNNEKDRTDAPLSVEAYKWEFLFAAVAEPGLVQPVMGRDLADAPAVDGLAARARTVPMPAALGSVWLEALKKAADCANQPIDDWSTLGGKEADRINNLIIFNTDMHRVPWSAWITGNPIVAPKIEHVRVTIRDHAAMLLLRDAFIQMMEAQLAEYERIEGPVMMRGFKKMIEPVVDNERYPLSRVLSRVKVTAPNGHEVSLGAIYMPDWVAEYFELSPGEARAWCDSALQQGLDRLRDSIRKSIARARSVEDCDVPELIELTGFGFQAVAEHLQPRLMKLSTTPDGRQKWVPDIEARNAVRTLHTLGSAVRAQEEYATADTHVAMAVASLVAMPLAAADGALAAGLALAVDAADVAVTLATEIPEYMRRRADVEFRQGASVVLGTEQLDDALARETSALELAVAVIGSGAGGAGSALEAAPKIRQAMRSVSVEQLREVGPRTMRLVEEGGLETLRNMNVNQQAELLAFMGDARQVRARAGVDALTEAQRRALKLADQLEAQATLRRPLADASADPDLPTTRTEAAPAHPARNQGEGGGMTGAVESAGSARKVEGENLLAEGSADGPRFDPPSIARPDRINPLDPGAPRPPRPTDDPTDAAPSQLRHPDAQPSAPRLPDSQPATPRLPDAQPTAPRLPDPQPTTPRLPNTQPTTPRLPDAQPTTPRLPDAQPSMPKLPAPNAPAPGVRTANASAPRLPDAAPPRLPGRPPVVRPPFENSPVARFPDPEAPAPPARPTARTPGPAPTPNAPSQIDKWPARNRPEAAPAAPPALRPVTRDRLDQLQKQLDEAVAAAPRRVRDWGGNDALLKDTLENLEQRRDLITDLRKHLDDHPDDADALRALGEDLDWLSGKTRQLTPDQAQRAMLTLRDRFGSDWARASAGLSKHPVDRILLHKIGTYRKQVVDQMLDTAIRRVEAITGKKLKRQAFGSTNLTSDYDLSIEGLGAELVVAEFNRDFRKLFGRESGTFFDTNVYTAPVYDFIPADSTVGRLLSPPQRDELRQFTYQHMAAAKYLEPGQWQSHVQRVLGATPEADRPILGKLLDEVYARERVARDAIAQRLARQPDPSDPDALLRVRNELYGESLHKIHELRKVLGNFDDLLAGKPTIFDLPRELRGSLLAREIHRHQQLVMAGRLDEANALVEDLRAHVANHMRLHQGRALYFAAEAYQTKGTIAHVVGELQAGKRLKSLTADDLMAATPADLPQPAGDYVASFFENQANLYKELNAAHALEGDKLSNALRPRSEMTEAQLAATRAKLEKVATKAGKYFVRQLDAAHRAGVKLTDALGDDARFIVERTLEIEAARSSPDKLKALLAKWSALPDGKAIDAQAFVERVLAAGQKLASPVQGRSPINAVARDLADYRRQFEADMAAEYAKDSRFIDPATFLGSGGKTPPSVNLDDLNAGRHLPGAQPPQPITPPDGPMSLRFPRQVPCGDPSPATAA